MLISWHSCGDKIPLGEVETKHCDVCQCERPFSMTFFYRYWGLYWVFSMVTWRRFALLCNVCQNGRELDHRQAEAYFPNVPIPFMRRFGLLTFLAMVLAAGLLQGMGVA